MGKDLDYFDGSLVFLPLAEYLDVSIDQVNFVICQLFCLLLAYPYRTLLSPDKHSATTRHIVQLILGLPIAWFCHGKQLYHIVLQSVTCFLLMRYMRGAFMARVVLAVAMGYLCVAHIYRQMYDYGSFVLDITGPLMINVQRLSSLAFGLHDGHVNNRNKLTPMMKQHSIKKLPSVLEYTSYVFSFHNFLCGPFSFYNDYEAFIDGSNYQVATQQDISNGNAVKPVKTFPSPVTRTMYDKLLAAVASALVNIILIPLFAAKYMLTKHFAEYSFTQKVLYVVICTTLQRQKYYCGWKLSEAVNMNAGFGFNGYDENGHAKWDLIENAGIRNIECASSLKVVIDNWNIMTSHWLRYIVYERWRSQLAVFMLSALWHGFYGGYYVMFFTTSLFVEAGRHIRRNIRPYFQTSEEASALYDVITWVGKTLAFAYMSFPFIMLDFWPSIHVYRELYFCLHIVAVLVVVFFSLVKPSSHFKSVSFSTSSNGSIEHHKLH